jgi:hypothetical protein
MQAVSFGNRLSLSAHVIVAFSGGGSGFISQGKGMKNVGIWNWYAGLLRWSGWCIHLPHLLKAESYKSLGVFELFGSIGVIELLG